MGQIIWQNETYFIRRDRIVGFYKWLDTSVGKRPVEMVPVLDFDWKELAETLARECGHTPKELWGSFPPQDRISWHVEVMTLTREYCVINHIVADEELR